MNRLITYLAILAVSMTLLSTQCDNEDNPPGIETLVINRSEETVLVFGGFSDYIGSTKNYSPELIKSFYKIECGDTLTFKMSIGYFNTGISFQLLVLEESLFNTYTAEDLVKYDVYNTKYVLPLPVLEEMGFKVIYTGQEALPHDTDKKI